MTGCYLYNSVLVNDILEKIKNPLWHIDLDSDAGQYDNASIFLQGSCHLFAYALNELFGYMVVEIINKNDGGNHSFCKTEVSGVPIFIDVRGATTNWNTFVSGTKYIDVSNCEVKEQHKKEFSKELAKAGARFGYDFAKYIIQTYPQFYDSRLMMGE